MSSETGAGSGASTGSSTGADTGMTSTTRTSEASGSATSSPTTGSSGVDSSGSSDTGPGPGVEPPCGFDTTLCMLAEGKTDPTDCGTVTLDDDDAAWDAAANCAATAAASQEAFKVAFQLPSKDSLVFDGYYGTVGIVYGVGRLYTDTLGDPMLGGYACTDITLDGACTPAVGESCLTCEGQGEVMPLECVM